MQRREAHPERNRLTTVFIPVLRERPALDRGTNRGGGWSSREKSPPLRLGVRGFTLVEILVVLAVTGLVTAGLVNFMVSQSRSYSLQEDLQEMEQNARVAIGTLEEVLKSASTVVTDPNGNDDGTPFNAGDDALLDGVWYGFKSGSVDSTDDAQSARLVRENAPIAYFITQDMDGDRIPETPIFQYDNPSDPEVVTVTIVARTRHADARYPKNQGYHQMVLTRRVRLRNR